MKYREMFNNNYQQNYLALNLLLEKGREALLDNNFYNELLKYAEDNPSMFMTVEFQKGYIKIAREMAQMNSNDLFRFIKNEIKVHKDKVMER